MHDPILSEMGNEVFILFIYLLLLSVCVWPAHCKAYVCQEKAKKKKKKNGQGEFFEMLVSKY